MGTERQNRPEIKRFIRIDNSTRFLIENYWNREQIEMAEWETWKEHERHARNGRVIRKKLPK